MLGHFSDRLLFLKFSRKTWVCFLKTDFGFYNASLEQHSGLGPIAPGSWLKPLPIHRAHYARFSPSISPGSGHAQNQLEQHASVFSPMLRSAGVWERHSYGPCLEGNDKSKQTWENWNLGALEAASVYVLLKCTLVNYPSGERERDQAWLCGSVVTHCPRRSGCSATASRVWLLTAAVELTGLSDTISSWQGTGEYISSWE